MTEPTHQSRAFTTPCCQRRGIAFFLPQEKLSQVITCPYCRAYFRVQVTAGGEFSAEVAVGSLPDLGAPTVVDSAHGFLDFLKSLGSAPWDGLSPAPMFKFLNERPPWPGAPVLEESPLTFDELADRGAAVRVDIDAAIQEARDIVSGR